MMPGTFLNPLTYADLLIFTVAIWDLYYYYLQLADEDLRLR